MDKNLNATVITSQGLWSSLVDDYVLLDHIYLTSKLFGQTPSKAFLTGYPEALDRLTEEQYETLRLYGMCTKQGLSTNPAVIHAQALTAIGGYIPRAQLPYCLWHVWLKYLQVY
jgi:hypothetical protein